MEASNQTFTLNRSTTFYIGLAVLLTVFALLPQHAHAAEGAGGALPYEGWLTALGSHRSRGGLGHAGVGLQGFVKHLHLPPFFVGRGRQVKSLHTRCNIPVLSSLFLKTWRTTRIAFAYPLSQPCTAVCSGRTSYRSARSETSRCY